MGLIIPRCDVTLARALCCAWMHGGWCGSEQCQATPPERARAALIRETPAATSASADTYLAGLRQGNLFFLWISPYTGGAGRVGVCGPSRRWCTNAVLVSERRHSHWLGRAKTTVAAQDGPSGRAVMRALWGDQTTGNGACLPATGHRYLPAAASLQGTAAVRSTVNTLSHGSDHLCRWGGMMSGWVLTRDKFM